MELLNGVGEQTRKPSSESLLLCHERNLLSLPRQERFFAFGNKRTLKLSKYRWNRSWYGCSDHASSYFCFAAVQLFAFLYWSKKLAKQHPTGFEYYNFTASSSAARTIIPLILAEWRHIQVPTICEEKLLQNFLPTQPVPYLRRGQREVRRKSS